MRSVVAFFTAVFALSACQTTSIGGSDVQSTWQDAAVGIPDALRGQECSGRATTDCLQKLNPGTRLPVVVYMHGCSGPNLGVVTDIKNLGYVTVAPNSLARARRTVDCAVGSDKKRIMGLRFQEAEYAAKALRGLAWVDQSKLILAGFSEGGVTAALYSGDEYAARIILGWTCTSADSWWNGIRGPSTTPVISVVGANDHYYQNRSNAGQCRLSSRPKSKSIVLKGTGHEVIYFTQTWTAVDEFLKSII
jgi:dienelactone hydrolase